MSRYRTDTETVSIGGLEIEVEFEWAPGEQQTRDDPGCGPECTILAARVLTEGGDGVDIQEFVNAIAGGDALDRELYQRLLDKGAFEVSEPDADAERERERDDLNDDSKEPFDDN